MQHSERPFSGMACGVFSKAHPGYSWLAMQTYCFQYYCKCVAAFALVNMAQWCHPGPLFSCTAREVSQQRPSKIVLLPQPRFSFPSQTRPLAGIRPFGFFEHCVRICIFGQTRYNQASLPAAKHLSRYRRYYLLITSPARPSSLISVSQGRLLQGPQEVPTLHGPIF